MAGDRVDRSDLTPPIPRGDEPLLADSFGAKARSLQGGLPSRLRSDRVKIPCFSQWNRHRRACRLGSRQLSSLARL
jgi:hypothetical protein